MMGAFSIGTRKICNGSFFEGNRVGIFEDTSVTIKVIYPKKLNTYGDDTM
jgi:hypothetical protein